MAGMRRVVVILSVVTLSLGAATAWLSVQLHDARTELAAMNQATPAATAPEAAPAAPRTPSAAPHPAPAVAASGSSGAPQPVGQAQSPRPEFDIDDWRATYMKMIPRYREILEDPNRRAAEMSRFRDNHRREFPDLARGVGLTEDEHDRLLTLLAEHQMDHLEATYRCVLDPNCEPRAIASMRSRNPPAELRQLLGDERLQRFNDYRDNSQERRIVANLRGVASDAVHISDKQAERLVEVLGDERRKFLKEFEQRGAEYSGLNSGLGSLYYSSTAQSAEQRVAEASEFQRRQRERAAEVLTPQQLEFFTERQKIGLEDARRSWEIEERQGGGP